MLLAAAQKEPHPSGGRGRSLRRCAPSDRWHLPARLRAVVRPFDPLAGWMFGTCVGGPYGGVPCSFAMAHFSGRDQEFATYGGLPVSRDPPHGVTIVVFSESPDGRRYLLLHRSYDGEAFEGDWAWTPPAGARLPGELVVVCAARELREETGIDAEPIPIQVHDTDCAVFRLEVPWGIELAVNDDEHDRHEWVLLEEACRRCLPSVVADALRLAARYSETSDR